MMMDKQNRLATLSIWCLISSAEAFVGLPSKFSSTSVARLGAQREDNDDGSSWASAAAASAVVGLTLTASQGAWAAPLLIIPGTTTRSGKKLFCAGKLTKGCPPLTCCIILLTCLIEMTVIQQRSTGSLRESPSLWMAAFGGVETMDFSMPSYSDSTGSSSGSKVKEAPSFNPFADTKYESTTTSTEEAPAPVKETASQRRAAEKEVADAKKAEEQAAADAKKAAKEARLQAEKEKQRVVLERQRQQPAKEDVVDEKTPVRS